jgi:hypothetical protein
LGVLGGDSRVRSGGLMRGEEWRVDGWKEEELRKYVLNMEKVGKASHEIRPQILTQS